MYISHASQNINHLITSGGGVKPPPTHTSSGFNFGKAFENALDPFHLFSRVSRIANKAANTAEHVANVGLDTAGNFVDRGAENANKMLNAGSNLLSLFSSPMGMAVIGGVVLLVVLK